MIVHDTHIWVWWVHQDERLTQAQREALAANETDTIGVSAISCWEIAKLVAYGRLELPSSLEEWFEQALNYPGRATARVDPGDCRRIHATTGRISS